MSERRRDGKVKTGRALAPALKGERMARVAKGATRIVPPVHALLNDIHTVAKTELARMLAKQAARPTDDTTPGLAKQLDQLSSAIERAFDLDVKIQERLGSELAELDEAALEARHRELSAGAEITTTEASDGTEDATEDGDAG